MTAIPETRNRYLVLQQEADFALWRAREANAETRRCYDRHLQGDGAAPTAAQLDEVRQLEQQAEEKYRALRTFLREHFEHLNLPA